MDGSRPLVRALGVSFSLLAALLLGFFGYLLVLSALPTAHAQATLYKSFRSKLAELGQSVAPVGPTIPGRPVALLDIPRLSLHSWVVVEGTAAGNLARGPGHRMDTPLPGEAGTSVIYGRRSTSGGPFERLALLRTGDAITATTGHGMAHYVVSAVGAPGRTIADPAPNRLVLVTAGPGWLPSQTREVSARLLGSAAPDDNRYPVPPAAHRALAGDDGALVPLMLWSAALIAAALIVGLGRSLWSRPATYLLGVPVVIAVTWNMYENAAQLLPNLY